MNRIHAWLLQMWLARIRDKMRELEKKNIEMQYLVESMMHDIEGYQPCHRIVSGQCH
jgi:hypothetical protein